MLLDFGQIIRWYGTDARLLSLFLELQVSILHIHKNYQKLIADNLQ